ncbi:MAG: DMT family transporter [Clostridia bacterium]|nr:DMT family transporter [Clostridia bacterium]
MGILLLLVNQAVYQCYGMVTRNYSRKHGSGGLFFNAIVCLFSMFFFIITDKGGFNFNKELFAYGAISIVMFVSGFYSMFIALQIGSYAISILLSSFSGVIAIVYGIVFLNEPAGLDTYLGILLTFVSVILMNSVKKGSEESNGFSAKWLICVLISLAANGFIAVLSRMQQIRFDNTCDNEFMIISLGGAFAVLFVYGLIRERNNVGRIMKHGTLYGAAAGIMNGAMNLIQLLVYLYMPISAATSVKTGLTTVCSFALSLAVYKEKFSAVQLAGAVIGVVALLLLV